MAQTNVGEEKKGGKLHELKDKLEGTHLHNFKVGLIHKKYVTRTSYLPLPNWLTCS